MHPRQVHGLLLGHFLRAASVRDLVVVVLPGLGRSVEATVWQDLCERG